MDNFEKEKMTKKKPLSKATWYELLINFIPKLIKRQWDSAREKK